MIEWIASLADSERWGLGLFAMLVIGVISQWSGQRIGHALAVRRERISVLRSAVIQYKAAFASGIAAIGDNSFALDTFSSAFLQHKAAVDAVRPILPKRSQRKLQKTWDEYRGKCNDLGYDDQGYVAAASATIYTTDKALFDDFKKRFTALHGCLDEWA